MHAISEVHQMDLVFIMDSCYLIPQRDELWRVGGWLLGKHDGVSNAGLIRKQPLETGGFN